MIWHYFIKIRCTIILPNDYCDKTVNAFPQNYAKFSGDLKSVVKNIDLTDFVGCK